MVLDFEKEMAWITFMHDGWETKWHAITDAAGKHLEFDSEAIMDFCRAHFGNVTFGIAPTSQMLMENAVRDNL
jgi:hypothetical protein